MEEEDEVEEALSLLSDLIESKSFAKALSASTVMFPEKNVRTLSEGICLSSYPLIRHLLLCRPFFFAFFLFSTPSGLPPCFPSS